jgi:hypothetical protein
MNMHQIEALGHEKSLEMVRYEVQLFLEREKETPSAQFVRIISSVYEGCLAQKENEVYNLLSSTPHLTQPISVGRGRKLKPN